MKTCTDCTKDFPETDDYFFRRADGSFRSTCKKCNGKAGTKRRQENRAKGLCHCGATPKEGRALCEAHLKAHSDRYYEINRNDPEWMRTNAERGHARLQLLKSAAFEAYGNACACCGEARVEFLSIDHIEPVAASRPRVTRFGSRNGERRPPPVRPSNRTGHGLYRWLKKNGYPEGFRVLCMNCNWARGKFGYCPHDRERALSA